MTSLLDGLLARTLPPSLDLAAGTFTGASAGQRPIFDGTHFAPFDTDFIDPLLPPYNAKADGREVLDAAIVATAAQLTSATANFTAADQGKAIMVVGAGTVQHGNAAALCTTIQTVINGTTVTLANAATTTVSGARARFASDDTSKIAQALSDAGSAVSTHRTVRLRASTKGGMYGITAAGLDGVTGTRLIMDEGVVLQQLAVLSGTDPAVVDIASTVTDFVVEGEIAGLHWYSGTYGNVASCGVGIRGGGRIRVNVRSHHHDGSCIMLGEYGTHTGGATDIVIRGETWGSGIDGFELNETGYTADRVTIDVVSHDNFLSGIEINGGTGAPIAEHVRVSAIVYSNGSATAGSGFRVSGTSGARQDSFIVEVEAYSNGFHGVELNLVDNITLAKVVSRLNGKHGFDSTNCTNLAAGANDLSDNVIRDLYLTQTTKSDLTFKSNNGGTGATAGTAAVEVNNGGGACSDLTLRGTIVGAHQIGFQATGSARCHHDITVVGSGAGAGANFITCTRATGFIRAFNNTSKGLQLTTSCVNCAFVVALGDDGPGVQTTGWVIADGGTTGTQIFELLNDCTTAFTDAGVSTQRMARQVIHQHKTVSDASYTAASTDDVIAYTALTAVRTVTIPAASAANKGKEYIVKDQVGLAGSFPITVVPASGSIDGTGTGTIISNAFGSRRVYSDGSNWYSVGNPNGARLSRTTTAGGNPAVAVNDEVIAYTSIAAAKVVTLPTPSTGFAGKVVWVKDESGSCSGTNTITVSVSGGTNIDGAASVVLAGAYCFAQFYCNGAKWFTLAQKLA